MFGSHLHVQNSHRVTVKIHLRQNLHNLFAYCYFATCLTPVSRTHFQTHESRLQSILIVIFDNRLCVKTIRTQETKLLAFIIYFRKRTRSLGEYFDRVIYTLQFHRRSALWRTSCRIHSGDTLNEFRTIETKRFKR